MNVHETRRRAKGRVKRAHIRAPTITLWDRSEMIVPNKEIIPTKLINWTLSDSRRRIDIPVRVAYGSDVQKVKDVPLKVATQHLHVLKEPALHVLL
ncbi:MAG: mechanosensitive ion channel domain-containing protein, partial [bacterium]